MHLGLAHPHHHHHYHHYHYLILNAHQHQNIIQLSKSSYHYNHFRFLVALSPVKAQTVWSLVTLEMCQLVLTRFSHNHLHHHYCHGRHYLLLCHHNHNHHPHHQPELSEIEEARCEAAATLVAGGFNRFNCLRKENESKTSVPPTPPPYPHPTHPCNVSRHNFWQQIADWGGPLVSLLA